VASLRLPATWRDPAAAPLVSGPVAGIKSDALPNPVDRYPDLHSLPDGYQERRVASAPLSTPAIRRCSIQKTNVDKLFAIQTGRAISHAFAKACKHVGIVDLHFHDLRHEATSRLFEITDLRDVEIASITGHNTMEMLKRYAHLRAARLVGRLG
jgi:integrase